MSAVDPPELEQAAVLRGARVVLRLVQYGENYDPMYRHAGIDLFLDPAVHGRGFGRDTAVGFKPVGVMRRYERGPDGTFHDGLLLDLVVEELIDAN